MKHNKGLIIDIGRNEDTCGRCRYFVQHWVYSEKFGQEFVPINAGHCTYPRSKNRFIHETCPHFEAGEFAPHVKMIEHARQKKECP